MQVLAKHEATGVWGTEPVFPALLGTHAAATVDARLPDCDDGGYGRHAVL